MRATFLLTASLAIAATTPAFAQVSSNNTSFINDHTSVPVVIGTSTQVTNRVVEPVTQSFDNLISAPIEYDENGVAKAQYFKASDLTPAQNQAFQEEVNRVRTYQSHNGGAASTPDYIYSQGTSTSYEAASISSAPITYGSTTISSDSITYGANAPVSASSYGSATEAAPITSGIVEIDLYEPRTYGSVDSTTYSSAPYESSQSVTIINEPAPQSFAAATHTIAKGDTLYNLSKRYNVTVGQLQAENGLSGTTLSLGQSLRIPSSAPYAASTSVAQPIFVSAPIRDGAVTRRIVQPVATTSRVVNSYAVLKGDTLYSIATSRCVSVNDLAAQNGITDPSSLQLGQKLTLPLGHCQKN